MLFCKKKKIEVFVRHCNFSKLSFDKKREKKFSKKACFNNLMQTKDSDVNCTFFIDTFHGKIQDHFLHQENVKKIEIKAGKEPISFLEMLKYVLLQKISDDTIIYFLEDDYIHLENWPKILREAFDIENVKYATLFDHRDKYFYKEYENLKSKIFVTKSCHFRETPSTTNTYAMTFKTLHEDQNIHKNFSENCEISMDHLKFLKLKEIERLLVSSIPGYSTHLDKKYSSPTISWDQILKKYSDQKSMNILRKIKENYYGNKH